MKLVATSSFRNTAPAKIIVADQIAPLHVHKGARLEIGGDAPFEKLTPDDKKLVTELNIAGRIVEAERTEIVAKIDAEVVAAARSEELISAANLKATNGNRIR